MKRRASGKAQGGPEARVPSAAAGTVCHCHLLSQQIPSLSWKVACPQVRMCWNRNLVATWRSVDGGVAGSCKESHWLPAEGGERGHITNVCTRTQESWKCTLKVVSKSSPWLNTGANVEMWVHWWSMDKSYVVYQLHSEPLLSSEQCTDTCCNMDDQSQMHLSV